MKVLLQRVTQAQLSIDQQVHAQIGRGVVLLVGFGQADQPANADYLATKIVKSRIFEDSQGKTNLALADVQGEILSVSQFTLYANTKKGNRPSFVEALNSEVAQQLYDYFNQCLAASGIKVQTGIFGADMQVQLTNDGPMTIIYES